MYSAIVYNSLTGSCRRYAELLSEELSIPCIPVNKAKDLKELKVVYIGWLMAGGIKGFKSASKKLNIGAVVQVGMSPVTEESEAKGRAKNDINPNVPLFSLQGGFNMKKLPLYFRPIMKAINKKIAKGLSCKSELTAQEQATLNMAQNGVGEPASWCVDDIVQWCRAH